MIIYKKAIKNRRRQIPVKKIIKYLLFTFITSWTFQITGARDFHLNNTAGMMSFGYALSSCMFMPTLGALFARADIRKMGWKPNIEKNIKPILFAWLMPTVFGIIGALLYYIVFPDDFDASGKYLMEADPSAFAELRENGKSYGSYVLKEIFYSLTSFYTLLAVFMGMGEEVGWRGFLCPQLKKILGRTKGVVLSGIIHGIWHFPIMILVGYEYGEDYIGAPLLGLFAFCIFTVSTGIISDCLYEKSHSIWLPAIFHGSVNSVANPNMLRGSEHFERTIFGPVSVGLISIIPMAAFAFAIIYLENRRINLDSEL